MFEPKKSSIWFDAFPWILPFRFDPILEDLAQVSTDWLLNRLHWVHAKAESAGRGCTVDTYVKFGYFPVWATAIFPSPLVSWPGECIEGLRLKILPVVLIMSFMSYQFVTRRTNKNQCAGTRVHHTTTTLNNRSLRNARLTNTERSTVHITWIEYRRGISWPSVWFDLSPKDFFKPVAN